jgi:hypothetical protein
MYKGKKISISITSSRRFPLLRRKLKSLTVFCKDINLLDEVIFFDDSSSIEDKSEMEVLLNQLFHDKVKTITHFYPDSFPDGYRHARILNHWRDKLIERDIDYTLHSEDDYLFVNHFSLAECINLIENNPEYGYVNLSQSWKNFPKEYQPKIIGDYWEWVYREDKEINGCLFLDDVASIQQTQPDIWLMYINWPSFSLRPGMMHVKKLLSIGEFSTTYDPSNMSVELEFAIRWSKKYKALCNKNFNVINLGFSIDDSNSAYNKNGSFR